MKRSDLKVGDKVVITIHPMKNYAGCAETMVDSRFWVAEVTDTKATFYKYTANDRLVEAAGVKVKLLSYDMRLNHADGITVEIEGKSRYQPSTTWGGGKLVERVNPGIMNGYQETHYINRDDDRVDVGQEIVISSRLIVNYQKANLDEYNAGQAARKRMARKRQQACEEAEEIKGKLVAYGVVTELDRYGKLTVKTTAKDLLRLFEQTNT
jgi:hypothetical protein